MKPARQVVTWFFVGLMVSASVSSCARTRPAAEPAAVTQHLRIVGAPDMNSGGNAAMVSVYRLANDTNFRVSSIDAFWEDDERTLGAELIGRKEQVLLYPEQNRDLSIELDSETRFIGFAANLRDPDLNRWREIRAVEQVRGQNIVVTVGADRITVDLR